MNISEVGYKRVCLSATSILNKKHELNIIIEAINLYIIGIIESYQMLN